MATKSDNIIGNPWHSEADGKFVSGNKNDLPSFLSFKTDDNINGISFLKKGGSVKNSLFDKAKKDRWWKYNKKRTVDDVVKNIGDYFDDEILGVLEKYGWKSCDSMNAGRTSHSYINKPLLNAIASKQFRPLNIMDTSKFDNLFNPIKRAVLGSYYNKTNAQRTQSYSFCERGFNNKDIINYYLGRKSQDLKLPAGACGSCIYTAYDGQTSKSYGRYQMKFLVDNSKAYTMTDRDARYYKSQLEMRMPEIEQGIRNKLANNPKYANYTDKVIHIFKNNLRDETFVPLLMGADMVYEEGSDYGLILNFGDVYTREDWGDI